jgi:phosphatidylglycerophosphatase A
VARNPAPSASPADRFAMMLATGFGSGYGPIAPGTWGSIPGVALAFGLDRLGGPWAGLAGVLVFAVAGVWAADRAERLLGQKDPGPVVVDEIAGQMLTLLFLPTTARVLLAGFFLFRVLDVLKPWPARRLEDLPGGSGIMADDLMVGLYANLILHGFALWQPAWMGLA